MDEGDVVQFCPACKHLLLRDEAVMVPSSTAFMLGVGHTLIRTPGLVVVVGNLLSSFLLSGKIKLFLLLFRTILFSLIPDTQAQLTGR